MEAFPDFGGQGGSQIKWRLPRGALGGGDQNVLSSYTTEYSSHHVGATNVGGSGIPPPKNSEIFDRVAGAKVGVKTDAHKSSVMNELIKQQNNAAPRASAVSAAPKQNQKWATGRFETTQQAFFMGESRIPEKKEEEPVEKKRPSMIQNMVRVKEEGPIKKRGSIISRLGKEEYFDEIEDETPEEEAKPVVRVEDRYTTSYNIDTAPMKKIHGDGRLEFDIAFQMSQNRDAGDAHRQEHPIWKEMAQQDVAEDRQTSVLASHFVVPPKEKEVDIDALAKQYRGAHGGGKIAGSPTRRKRLDHVEPSSHESAFVIESQSGARVEWEDTRPPVTKAQMRRLLRADPLNMLESFDEGPDRWTSVSKCTVGPDSYVAVAERATGGIKLSKRNESAYVRESKPPASSANVGE